MFEGICEAMYREMERLEQKYQNGNVQMNGQDLKDIDMMAHALKSLATYEAMKGNSEYGASYGGSYNGGSYARTAVIIVKYRMVMTGKKRGCGYNSASFLTPILTPVLTPIIGQNRSKSV